MLPSLIKLITKSYNHLSRDSLIRNSFFISLSSIMGGILGTLFWMIAARLFKESELGIMISIISVTTILSLVSRGGIDIAIIKFLPTMEDNNEKRIFLVISFITTFLLSLIISFIYVLFIKLLTPELSFIKNNLVLLLIIFVSPEISLGFILIANIFIAETKSEFLFLQNMLLCNLKILFLLLFKDLGALSILIAIIISLILSIIASIFIFLPRVIGYSLFSGRLILKPFSKRIYVYSLVNHISNIVLILPNLLLPLIALELFDSESVSFFYIAWSTFSILFMFPSSLMTSFFAEGSNRPMHQKRTGKKTIIINLTVLIPLIFMGIVFSPLIMMFFGKSYSISATPLLQVLLVSALPGSFINYFISKYRVNEETINIIITSCINTIISLFFVIFMGMSSNLLGMCSGWLIGQLISLMIILLFNFISFRSISQKYHCFNYRMKDN